VYACAFAAGFVVVDLLGANQIVVLKNIQYLRTPLFVG
jgi:hypothetical protein